MRAIKRAARGHRYRLDLPGYRKHVVVNRRRLAQVRADVVIDQRQPGRLPDVAIHAAFLLVDVVAIGPGRCIPCHGIGASGFVHVAADRCHV